MFFHDRLISIKPTDRVLEIGPGATPHARADVFLERDFDSDTERIAQSGHVGILKTDKPIVYYSGQTFPFKDKEFDYIICSHVLEHVVDVPGFLNEILRVGKSGYLEFPTVYYDYLYNIEEHLNILFYNQGTIFWCKKTDTPIATLGIFTDFFRETQHKGYRFQKELNSSWIHGFEWHDTIPFERVTSLSQLTYPKSELNQIIVTPPKNTFVFPGVILSFRLLVGAILRKIGLKK
jgi:SAM-dependent methyltransferase